MSSHPDTSRALHAARTAGLYRAAHRYRLARTARAQARARAASAGLDATVRDRLGWSLVRLGLLLVEAPTRHPDVSPAS